MIEFVLRIYHWIFPDGFLGGPSDTAESGLWRVGNHYKIHVYAGERPVATFHDPADAARAVAAVNAQPLPAESVEAIKGGRDGVVRAWHECDPALHQQGGVE